MKNLPASAGGEVKNTEDVVHFMFMNMGGQKLSYDGDKEQFISKILDRIEKKNRKVESDIQNILWNSKYSNMESIK